MLCRLTTDPPMTTEVKACICVLSSSKLTSQREIYWTIIKRSNSQKHTTCRHIHISAKTTWSISTTAPVLGFGNNTIFGKGVNAAPLVSSAATGDGKVFNKTVEIPWVLIACAFKTQKESPDTQKSLLS